MTDDCVGEAGGVAETKLYEPLDLTIFDDGCRCELMYKGSLWEGRYGVAFREFLNTKNIRSINERKDAGDTSIRVTFAMDDGCDSIATYPLIMRRVDQAAAAPAAVPDVPDTSHTIVPWKLLPDISLLRAFAIKYHLYGIRDNAHFDEVIRMKWLRVNERDRLRERSPDCFTIKTVDDIVYLIERSKHGPLFEENSDKPNTTVKLGFNLNISADKPAIPTFSSHEVELKLRPWSPIVFINDQCTSMLMMLCLSWMSYCGFEPLCLGDGRMATSYDLDIWGTRRADRAVFKKYNYIQLSDTKPTTFVGRIESVWVYSGSYYHINMNLTCVRANLVTGPILYSQLIKK